ncbi:MAG: hypothetical protein II306_06435 [Clostridia bacterium]|nr:hypothetical protein [Clostridia bacterium]
MEFAKGIKVKTVTTQYGEIIKLGINKKTILENQTEGDWLNIDLKKSKEKDEWYQCINDFKKS